MATQKTPEMLPFIANIPDPVTRRAIREMFTRGVPMGTFTQDQIEALNTAIAGGSNPYPIGASLIRQEDGAVLTLQGVDAEARFTSSGTSEGVAVQSVRTSNFTLVPSDSGTIIPVTGNVTVTINADSDLSAPVEIRRMTAGTLGVVSAGGASIINPLTGSAWGTLQVTSKLSSIAVYLGSAADEYAAYKIGA